MTAGEAESLSAYVESAIREKLRRDKRDRLYLAYREAALDPAFMADMSEVAAELDSTVGDGLRDD